MKTPALVFAFLTLGVLSGCSAGAERPASPRAAECSDHTRDEYEKLLACDEATAPQCGFTQAGHPAAIDGTDPHLHEVCMCIGGRYGCFGSPGLDNADDGS